MRRGFHPAKFGFFLIAAVVFVLVISGLIMVLWNAILPDLLGIKTIEYWQAVGLFVLSRILFGRFFFGPGGGFKKHAAKRAYWKEKWKNMTEEERAKMKEKWRRRRSE